MATFIAATGKGDIHRVDRYKTIFAVGALLFVMTFLLNIFSTWMVNSTARSTTDARKQAQQA